MTNVHEKKNVNSLQARSCHKCITGTLLPEGREWTGMETTVTYVCSNCKSAVDFMALSQAGLMTAIGMIILGIVSFFMFESYAWWGVVDYLSYSIVVLMVGYIPIYILYPYWRHPIVKEPKTSLFEIDPMPLQETERDPPRRLIFRFERFGFWQGFFAPIIFISLILGIATAIGMVNHYVR